MPDPHGDMHPRYEVPVEYAIEVTVSASAEGYPVILAYHGRAKVSEISAVTLDIGHALRKLPA